MLRRHAFELELRQSRVEAFGGAERGVGALFDDPAAVHDDDAAGGADGCQAMRDDHRGAGFHQPLERFLDELLAARFEKLVSFGKFKEVESK